MSLLGNMKTKMKRVKGGEWAMLLIVLGLAGSLLLTPGAMQWFSGSTAPMSQTDDSLEGRLASVLSSMEGAGRVEVVIHYTQPAATAGSWLDTTTAKTAAEPVSVIVVAEGAGDLMVKLELARAVQTLLRLDADAVEIFKMDMKKEGE